MTDFEKVLLPLLAILPLIAFIAGRLWLRKKTALYFRMIVDGVGCIALYRMFLYLKYLTEEVYPQGFHVGILGLFGVFAFFFTANYGQIDTLGDDGAKQNRKYRLAALAMPVSVLAALVLSVFFFPTTEDIIVYGILSLMVAAAGYYHLKHMIFPDVDFGVIRCLRPFNALALGYSVLALSEFWLIALCQQIALYEVMIVGGVISALMVPCVVMGVKKWTI